MAASALLLTACGGGSDGSPPTEPIASVTEQPASTDVPAADDAIRFASAGDPQYARAIELAEPLIEALGLDETAAEALLRSFELGHDADQLVAGVENGALAETGAIDDVAPANAPLGRIVGLRRVAQEEPLPIEQLREEAFKIGESLDFPVGTFATTGILVLLASGKSVEEIVEALVFGEVTYIRDGVCYSFVFGLADADGDRECASSATSSTVAAAEPSPTTPPEPLEPVGEPGEGVYQASITDFASVNGLVVGSTSTNSISIDLSGDVPAMSFSYEIRLAPDNYADDSAVVCQIDLDFDAPLAPIDGATETDRGWSGQLATSLGVSDGTCPAGSTDNETQAGSLDVAFTVTDSTVTGTLEGGGDVLSFSGNATV